MLELRRLMATTPQVHAMDAPLPKTLQFASPTKEQGRSSRDGLDGMSATAAAVMTAAAVTTAIAATTTKQRQPQQNTQKDQPNDHTTTTEYLVQ